MRNLNRADLEELLFEYLPSKDWVSRVLDAAERKFPYAECPSCDDSWASHVAGMHAEPDL